jgi:hypothetical protein
MVLGRFAGPAALRLKRARDFLRLLAALAMSIPATVTAWSLSLWIGGHELGQIFVVVGAAVVALGTYLVWQRAWGAPELARLRLGTGAIAPSRER